MTTLQIEIDEATAAAIREKAQLAGKTPEILAAEIVRQQFPLPPDKSWIKDFLEGTETAKGDSKGWKWNREELYDR